MERSAGLLGLVVHHERALAIASRARGTPRIVNRLLRRVRDVAQVTGRDIIDHAVPMEALDLLEVDHIGLEEIDRRILRCLAVTFEGRPVDLILDVDVAAGMAMGVLSTAVIHVYRTRTERVTAPGGD